MKYDEEAKEAILLVGYPARQQRGYGHRFGCL
jgi:hypothetical protein